MLVFCILLSESMAENRSLSSLCIHLLQPCVMPWLWFYLICFASEMQMWPLRVSHQLVATCENRKDICLYGSAGWKGSHGNLPSWEGERLIYCTKRPDSQTLCFKVNHVWQVFKSIHLGVGTGKATGPLGTVWGLRNQGLVLFPYSPIAPIPF